LRLKILHFTRGTYQCNTLSSYPTNRLLCIVANPSGSANCFDSGRLTMESGRWYLVPQGRKTNIKMDGKIHFVSIHFNADFLYGIDLFSRSPEIFTEADPHCIAAVEEVYTNSDYLAGAIELAGIIWQIIGTCLPAMECDTRTMLTVYGKYSKLLDFLTKNLNAGVQVSDMAESVHACREHFSRNFTRAIGISPGKFFHRMLVNRAAELLLEPDATVQDVAHRLKFCNSYYFSHFFKQNYGMAPHQFQKTHRLRSEPAFRLVRRTRACPVRHGQQPGPPQ